jgi:hypothetical protein
LESKNIKAKEDKVETTWEKSELAARLLETFLRLIEIMKFLLKEIRYKVMSAKLIDHILKLLEDDQLSERFHDIR